MASEWLSLQQAAEMIDGAEGWRVESDSSRPSLLALYRAAEKGLVATSARIWNCRQRLSGAAETYGPANEDQRSDLLCMLFAREKGRADSWNTDLGRGGSIHGAISLADERAGNFDAFRIMFDDRGKKVQSFTVLGLAFKRSDVEAAFDCKSRLPGARKTRTVQNHPPLPEGKLQKWWTRLGDDIALPEAELLRMCREAFPSNAISRDRLRRLIRVSDPDRKRGPKPFRRKVTA